MCTCTASHFVLLGRKTKVGDIEIEEVRPPRFIGRDGVSCVGVFTCTCTLYVGVHTIFIIISLHRL